MTYDITKTTVIPELIDPVDQLNDAKEAIQKKLAANKLLLKQAQSELRKIEKLSIEIVTDKKQKYEEKLAEITALNDIQIELDTDFKNLNRTRDDENEEKIQAALMCVDRDWIKKEPSGSYIIEDQEFVFIKDYSNTNEKLNVQACKMEPARFVEYLSNELGVKSWHLPIIRVKDLFNMTKRSYQISRYSIDPTLWRQDKIYLPIRHMEQYFIDQVVIPADKLQEANSSLQFFDWLMYSLSGGKKENQDHIEQFILHKVINYNKAVTTPDIVIVGHVGGNGKGILQAIIRLMFPSCLSGKANSKTLNGNFNAIMLGKLVVFFDDQNSKEIPLEVVKQLAGSETMIFEPKGKDQYEGEKTHSSAWFSQELPFKLTPGGQEGGVDRRFSIMRTNITFLESLRMHYKDLYDTEISVEQSKDFAEAIVGKELLNRINIAAWFQYLKTKHPQVDKNYTLKPLHGEDYKYFLDRQATSFDTIFKDFVAIIIQNGGCVPTFIVKELVRHLDGRTTADKTIAAKMMELAQQNKLDVIIDRERIEILNPGGISIKKQCSILRPTNSKKYTNHAFDWSIVSSKPYTGFTSIGQELIPEGHLIFGNVDSEDTNETDNELNNEFWDDSIVTDEDELVSKCLPTEDIKDKILKLKVESKL